jgi:hypothetical protein
MKWDGTVATQANRGLWDQARMGRFTASVIHKLFSERDLTDADVDEYADLSDMDRFVELKSGERKGQIVEAKGFRKQLKDKMRAAGIPLFGDDGLSLIAQVAGERITQTPPFPATSAPMEWGLNTEEEAYVHLCEHWKPLEHAVFAPYGEFAGATPDAITSDGLMTVDIKCPYGSGVFVKWALIGDGEEALFKFSKEYYWQIMMQAKSYGVERCALAYYDPRLPDTATKFIAREYTLVKEVSDRLDAVLNAAEAECLRMMEAMAERLTPVIA